MLVFIVSAVHFFFSWLSVKVIWINGIVWSGCEDVSFSSEVFPIFCNSKLFPDPPSPSTDKLFLVATSLATFGGDVDFAFTVTRLPIGPRCTFGDVDRLAIPCNVLLSVAIAALSFGFKSSTSSDMFFSSCRSVLLCGSAYSIGEHELDRGSGLWVTSLQQDTQR